MKVEMIMPQMGESIAEGAIVKWLKGVGDLVELDEDILEISTDKVDSEIPSPATGRIVEILVKEGQTVPIKTVLAVIETEAGAAVAGGEPFMKTPPPPPPASVGGNKAAASEGKDKTTVSLNRAEQVTPQRPPAQESSPHDGSADGGFVAREFRRSVETQPEQAGTPVLPAAKSEQAETPVLLAAHLQHRGGRYEPHRPPSRCHQSRF